MERYFDFVCLSCRRTNQYSLELLNPGHSFRCPYCKSAFSVVDDKIKMVEAGRSIHAPLLHQLRGTIDNTSYGAWAS